MNGNQHLIRQVDYAAGATKTEELSGVQVRAPSGMLNFIRGVYVELFLSVTAASTSDAVTARQMFDFIQALEMFDGGGGKFLFGTPIGGHLLRIFESWLAEKAVQSVTGVSANSNAVWTRTLALYVPLQLPQLDDDRLCMQPAARLEKGHVRVRFPASTFFGTGQTIGTGRVRVYLDVVPMAKMKARPELFLYEKVPSTFRQDRVPVRGALAYFGLAIPGASATLASNDFTDYGIKGQNDLEVPRGSDPDVPTLLYNRYIADQAAEKTLLSAGSIVDALLLFAKRGSQLSDWPLEEFVEVTLTAGAGNPAAADQSFAYVVVQPKDAVALGKALSVSTAGGGLSADEWAKRIDAARLADGGEGVNGNIDAGHRYEPFVATVLPMA